ncbi:hypothetical protein AIOL_002184 [Candidatus Rhodobacter oscarellae]|uniref:Uncharacterized protein n=1 Tax=Candidatus Rhodobacter oscarellae TaxID=1675527 RepID=A0A0J9GUG1_9RHOB|nr:hypothetical protein [Candidatus Rhodobacter lobularis]KMW57223.1 hypothetical protein AIOL_002184 [Candidatus Rhodobacter lobularis]
MHRQNTAREFRTPQGKALAMAEAKRRAARFTPVMWAMTLALILGCALVAITSENMVIWIPGLSQ